MIFITHTSSQRRTARNAYRRVDLPTSFRGPTQADSQAQASMRIAEGVAAAMSACRSLRLSHPSCGRQHVAVRAAALGVHLWISLDGLPSVDGSPARQPISSQPQPLHPRSRSSSVRTVRGVGQPVCLVARRGCISLHSRSTWTGMVAAAAWSGVQSILHSHKQRKSQLGDDLRLLRLP